MKWWLPALLLLVSACGRQEPAFLSLLLPGDTYDTVGPYRIEATIYAPNGVGRLLLRVEQEPGAAPFSERSLAPVNPEEMPSLWFVELPGRPPGTEYRFHLMLSDVGGALVRDPENAPEELHSFRVLFAADMLQ